MKCRGVRVRSQFIWLLQGSAVYFGSPAYGRCLLLLGDTAEKICQTSKLQTHQKQEIQGNQTKAIQRWTVEIQADVLTPDIHVHLDFGSYQLGTAQFLLVVVVIFSRHMKHITAWLSGVQVQLHVVSVAMLVLTGNMVQIQVMLF